MKQTPIEATIETTSLLLILRLELHIHSTNQQFISFPNPFYLFYD